MSGTCKTCQFWGLDEQPVHANAAVRDKFPNIRPCLSPKVHFIGGGYHRDGQPAVSSRDPHHVLDGDEVGVEDGSGFWAFMFTGPDFGCIHHSPKEPQ
jgi:hypothetical protein